MSETVGMLTIGQPEIAAIEDLCARAAAQPLDMDAFNAELHTPEGVAKMSATINSFTIRIPNGYLVTYTVSRQPVGLCRLLSVSVGAINQRMTPHSGAVQALALVFGFEGGIEDWITWKDTPIDGLLAVNVLQPLAAMAEAAA